MRACQAILSLLSWLGLLSLATGMIGTFTALSDEFAVSSHQLESRITNHELPQTDVRELMSGVPIKRELAGGEVHAYQVTLVSGQYLHVAVEQQGVDVIVRS